MQEPPSVLPPTPAGVAPKHQAILIVEHEPSLSQLVQMILANEGYTAIAAITLDNAIRFLTSIEVDLVVTNYMEFQYHRDGRWPVLDMFKALVKPGTPFVVTTTCPFALSQTPQDLGIADIIAKPFDLDDFLARVSNAIVGRQQ